MVSLNMRWNSAGPKPTAIAGYRIVAEIGSGGMSAVYLAEDSVQGTRVALKVLDPHLSWDDSGRERFLREAQHAASLEHPNVLPIFDAGEADGMLYIAMPYVDGSDLASIIATHGKLDPARTLAILTQVAAALDFAHGRGLIHRDVKPQNILVAPAREPGSVDRVFLADFGLAKSIATTSRRTATDQIIGTINYVAPEHIANQPVDHRADVYALGCVLFECLTGQRPYERDSDFQVLWAHAQDDPPSVKSASPALSFQFDKIIAVALAKQPSDRYQCCADLIRDFEVAATDSRRSKRLIADDLTTRGVGGHRRASRPSLDLYARGATGGRGRVIRRLAGAVTAVFVVSSVVAGVTTSLRSNGERPPSAPTMGPDERQERSRKATASRERRSRTEQTSAPVAVEETGSFSLSGRAGAGVPHLLDPVAAKLPIEATPPSMPRPGRYVYSLTGSEAVCGYQNGLRVCPPREPLPTRMIVRVTREKATDGDDIVMMRRYWSDDSEMSSTIRFTDGAARTTATRFSLNYGGFELDAFYRLRPPPRWLVFPLRVGSSWTDRWLGQTRGALGAEVVSKDRIPVGGEANVGYRVLSTTRFQGRSAGRLSVTEWVDPESNLAIRSRTDLVLKDGSTEYETSFDTRLISGPGYP